MVPVTDIVVLWFLTTVVSQKQYQYRIKSYLKRARTVAAPYVDITREESLLISMVPLYMQWYVCTVQ